MSRIWNFSTVLEPSVLALGTKPGQDRSGWVKCPFLQSFDIIEESRGSIPIVMGSRPGFFFKAIYYAG